MKKYTIIIADDYCYIGAVLEAILIIIRDDFISQMYLLTLTINLSRII